MLVSVQQAPFTQNPSFLFPIQRLEEGSDGGNREERQSERAAVRGQVRSSSWTRIKEEGDRLLLCAPPPPCFSQRYNTATSVRGRVQSSPAAGETCWLSQSSQHTQSLSELGQLSFSGTITSTVTGMGAGWRIKSTSASGKTETRLSDWKRNILQTCYPSSIMTGSTGS